MEIPSKGQLRTEIEHPKPAGFAERLGVAGLTFPWRRGLAIALAAEIVASGAIAASNYRDIRVANQPPPYIEVRGAGEAQHVPYLGLTENEYYANKTLNSGDIASFDGGAVIHDLEGITINVFPNRLRKLSHDSRVGINSKDDIIIGVYFSKLPLRQAVTVDGKDISNKMKAKYSSEQRKQANMLDLTAVSVRDIFFDYFINRNPEIRLSLSDYREEISSILSIQWAASMTDSIASRRGQRNSGLSKEAEELVGREKPIQITSVDPGVFQKFGLN